MIRAPDPTQATQLGVEFGFVYSADADGGRRLCVFRGLCVDM